MLRGKTSFDNFSWLLSAAYKVTPDTMVYARVSTGYRSGGINPRATSINTFKPEKAMSYEAGIKTELFDRHLRFNLSGYLTDYTNMQVNQFAGSEAGSTSIIANAGKAQVRGFEAEFTLLPVRGLTIDGAVGYVDKKYKSFLFADPNDNFAISDVASQAKQTYSPKWTARIGAEYTQPIGDMNARLRVDYAYRSSLYFNVLNATTPFNENIKSPADDNLKARFALEDIKVAGGTMEIGVWGDNLTNEKTLVYGIDFGSLGFAGATFKKPRSYGIDAKISF
jgi:iron complex outermembrane receptor protein